MLLPSITLSSSVMLGILTQLTISLLVLAGHSEASCRSASDVSICCIGKQSHCYGFEIDYENSPLFHRGFNKTELERLTKFRGAAIPSGIKMRRCFCDDSCMATKDCCADYRMLCEKPTIDCEVSHWSDWSKCSNKCGHGYEKRTRSVLVDAQNGGQACPMLKDERPCQGTDCGRRRVGRSNLINSYNFYNKEVVNIISVRGNPRELLKLDDPRYDIRRQLFYSRLIKENKTEEPDPEPYSIVYEVENVNAGCHRDPPNRRGSSYDPWQQRRRDQIGIRPGNFICITCFANFMRRELNNKCIGTQYGGQAFRFRNLDKFDCYGTVKRRETYQGRDKCLSAMPHFAFL